METLKNTTQGGNEVNEAKKNVSRKVSKFHPSYRNFQTMRFGDVTPFFCMECVPGDKIQLQSKHRLQSLSLKSPLFSNIGLKKDYFSVPYECILPRNWEKIFTNPIVGDDVPTDANCVIDAATFSKFLNAPINFLSKFIVNYKSEYSSDTDIAFKSLMCFLTLGNNLYSYGSLWKELGYSSEFFANDDINKSVSIQSLFQVALQKIYDVCFSENNSWNSPLITSITFVSSTDDVESSSPYAFTRRYDLNKGWSISAFNELLDLCAAYPNFSVSYLAKSYDQAPVDNLVASLGDILSVSALVSDENFYCNFSRLFAYQIVLASFYTDDKIDFVYSAELFRETFHSIGLPYYKSISSPFFEYNGLNIEYDYLSGFYLNRTILGLYGSSYSYAFQSIMTILAFGRSLKFRDYFVGSRPTPLAVGDNGIAVVDDSVSVLDVTKSLAMQRFRNQVVRVGRKAKDYLEGIFGSNPSAPLTEPIFLSHTTDVISSIDTENTSNAQQTEENSITSRFNSGSSKYVFEFIAERNCILLGLMSFDVRRCYPLSMSRFNTIVDRFDMFNPFLQYIGDQDIYNYEYNAKLLYGSNGKVAPFAYTLRDMQYKQRTDEVSGGFISGRLPSWNFNDYISSLDVSETDNPIYSFISPEFIRQSSRELDKFFLVLTGLGYDEYFHFEVVSDNEVTAYRPMAFAPSVL